MILIKKWTKENNGQALIELLIGFSILTIVMVSITFLIIGTREASTRAANISKAQNSLIFQNEALRSVRESGWDKLENGTYHLISGPEYRIFVCYQTGCEPPLSNNSILDEATGSTNGSGELSVSFDFVPPNLLPGLTIHAEKITDCTSPPCTDDSLVRELSLKDLQPNRPMAVLVCNPRGCGTIQRVDGTSDGNGKLTVNFTYPAEQSAVSIFVFKLPGTDGCSGFGCLQRPTIKNMTVGGLEPGTSWALSPGSQVVDGYTRQVNIGNVCRDGSGTIVDCSVGTIDPSTKKMTSKVTWEHFFGGNLENTFYLTRYLNNDTWVQTTKAEFDTGIYYNTVTTQNGDGEVQLGSGEDWSKPKLSGHYNNEGNQGVEDAFDVTVSGDYAYLVSDDGGGRNDLAIIDVSDQKNPFEEGTIDIGTSVNGVFVEDNNTDGRFAYLATTSDTRELIVVDVNNKSSPSEVESLNLGDEADALDIFVSGTGNKKFAYIGKQSAGGTNKELYIVSINTCFDLTSDNEVNFLDWFELRNHLFDPNPGIHDLNGDGGVNTLDILILFQRFFTTCPHTPYPTIMGSFEVGGSVNDIFVSDNKAFLATSKNDEEFIAVDLSNITNLQKIISYDLPSNSNATAVYIDNNKAYLTTEDNPSGSEFYVIDIGDPSSLCNPTSECGDFDVGGTVNDLKESNGLAFLATDINTKEFIVLNVFNVQAISEFGFRNLPTAASGANGISLDGNYAFLATDHNRRELQIIEAGSGSAFASFGIFESQTFDCALPSSPATQICAGDKAGFNFLTWAGQKQGPTNLQLQIATNDDSSTWNFVGPDSTGSSFYEDPGAIPLDFVQARYFRYKVILTGNGGVTPILNDFTLNYSP